jgi:transmembrane sensor
MADDLEAEAASFILAREDDSWCEDDASRLADWLGQSERHKAVFWRLEQGWRDADRIRALGPAPEVEPARQTWGWLWKPLALAAAAALPVLAGWTLLQAPADPAPATYETEVGARKLVSLPDGSTIDMNTDSRIRVAYTDRARTIFLDRGEAFFDVAHEAGRPFLVRSEDREIRDIGTRFLVRKTGSTLIAAVKQGQVRIDGNEPGQSGAAVMLSAGDRAVMTGRTTLTVARDMAYVDANLAWRDGVLRLDGIELGEAAAQFNRYNRKRLTVVGPQLVAIRIGGVFSPYNLDGFARLLRDAYGLKIRESEKEIKISRK